MSGSHHQHGAGAHLLLTTARGLFAVRWSFVILLATAAVQAAVVATTGSVALLADTLHGLGDAFTAIPLWVAFHLMRRPPSRRFTYGYGRVEDMAGVVIVLTILCSALLAGWQAWQRLLHPQPVERLGALVAAGLLGCAANELVAWLRIRAGRAIGSAALVADGQHARTDGLTSLGVVLGALGLWAGWPWADPAVAFVIAGVILAIAISSGRSVAARLLDGIDPPVLDDIRGAAAAVPGVRDVLEVRARWIGHRLHAEVNVAVDASLSVVEGHAIAIDVQRRLLERLPHFSLAVVHVDPLGQAGEELHPRRD